jgi:hypothetical protein
MKELERTLSSLLQYPAKRQLEIGIIGEWGTELGIGQK